METKYACRMATSLIQHIYRANTFLLWVPSNQTLYISSPCFGKRSRTKHACRKRSHHFSVYSHAKHVMLNDSWMPTWLHQGCFIRRVNKDKRYIEVLYIPMPKDWCQCERDMNPDLLVSLALVHLKYSKKTKMWEPRRWSWKEPKNTANVVSSLFLSNSDYHFTEYAPGNVIQSDLAGLVLWGWNLESSIWWLDPVRTTPECRSLHKGINLGVVCCLCCIKRCLMWIRSLL